ncbi:MORN repeat-containing protein [Shimia sp.]|uniref:MORN repeat-containing protein n=1 Tax=Shimia sp. TaxID=1954381 RepID=UPI003B8A9BD7
MSSRSPSSLGIATDGMMLSQVDQIAYPLRVEHVHVGVGDYVDEDTFVYVVIDRNGVPFGFQPNKAGQITRVMAAVGDIFTEPQRVFELCCDEQAQGFAAERAIKTEFRQAARPAAQTRATKTAIPPASPRDRQGEASTSGGGTRRLGMLGTLVGLLIIAGVIMGANGTFDDLYTRFDIWRNPANYGYASYQDYLDKKENPAPVEERVSEGNATWQGLKYTGGLKNYKPHGEGKLALAGYEEYFGTWVDGVRQAEGYTKILFRDAKREGTFNDDLLLDGQGTQVFDSGDRYEGQFRAGLRHGRGVYRFADGAIYEGAFVENTRHGTGTLKFANGDVFTGDFKENERTGDGTYSFASGSRYSGGFLNGKWHGQGVMQHSDGTSFEGSFEEGVRHGIGTLKFANGVVYVGDFASGLRTGTGKLTFPSGAYYEGAFLDGRVNGRGVYRNATGDITTGEFNNGLAEGTGSIKYANGDSYTGDFKDFKRDGLSEFEKAAEVRRKAERDRWAWVDRMRQRHDDRKDARARMRRLGNRNSTGQSLEDDLRAPGRVFWARFHPGDVPENVGETVACPGGYLGDAECSIVRKEKVWTLQKGCGSNGAGSGRAEAFDKDRIIVFEARGDLTDVLEALDAEEQRGNSGDSPEHYQVRVSKGLLTSFLVDDIWRDLQSYKARVNDRTYENTGVRDMRVFFRTYTSLATYSLTSGCYVLINDGSPSKMR